MRHADEPLAISNRIAWRKAPPGQRLVLEPLWAKLNGVWSSPARVRAFRSRPEAGFLETHFSKAYLAVIAQTVMRRSPDGRLLLSDWYEAVQSDHVDFMAEVAAHYRREEQSRQAESRQRRAQEARDRRAEEARDAARRAEEQRLAPLRAAEQAERDRIRAAQESRRLEEREREALQRSKELERWQRERDQALRELATMRRERGDVDVATISDICPTCSRVIDNAGHCSCG